jgi:hypothetical protein
MSYDFDFLGVASSHVCEVRHIHFFDFIKLALALSVSLIVFVFFFYGKEFALLG